MLRLCFSALVDWLTAPLHRSSWTIGLILAVVSARQAVAIGLNAGKNFQRRSRPQTKQNYTPPPLAIVISEGRGYDKTISEQEEPANYSRICSCRELGLGYLQCLTLLEHDAAHGF